MCQFYNNESVFGNAAFFASLIEIWNWFDKNAACNPGSDHADLISWAWSEIV